MTRVLTISLVVTSFLLAAPGSAATRHSTLRLVDRAPLTLEGRQFRARERVRVEVVAATQAAHTVVATRGGSFTTSFESITVDRCEGFAASATGSRGSVAYVNFPAPASCLPM